jgi:hypothetical protein
VGQWRALMLDETWYGDRAAVDVGLADSVDGDSQAAAAGFDLSVFRHPPPELAAMAAGPPSKAEPTKRTIERALRDAGLSHTQAKAAVAAAWASIEPDEAARDVSAELALLDAIKKSLLN